MRFTEANGRLNGTGSLLALQQPGGESLTLVGDRIADTLDITFARSGVPSFTFRGWFTTTTRISGVLDGAEFSQVGVTFRKQ